MTSFYRPSNFAVEKVLPLVVPVEKATFLCSNASCDDPSLMPSSGESREQSEAETVRVRCVSVIIMCEDQSEMRRC